MSRHQESKQKPLGLWQLAVWISLLTKRPLLTGLTRLQIFSNTTLCSQARDPLTFAHTNFKIKSKTKIT